MSADRHVDLWAWLDDEERSPFEPRELEEPQYDLDWFDRVFNPHAAVDR